MFIILCFLQFGTVCLLVLTLECPPCVENSNDLDGISPWIKAASGGARHQVHQVKGKSVTTSCQS